MSEANPAAIERSSLPCADRPVMSTTSGWYLSGRLSPGDPVMRIPIDTDSFVVGRRQNAQLQLKSLRVSGQHAELLLVSGFLFIRDLGSTNGTFVNGRRLDRTCRIREGDHIEFADVEFRVEFEHSGRDSTDVLEALKKTNHCLGSLEAEWVFSQFDRLVRERLVIPHYQSIVRMSDLSISGFEALARSDVPGLNNPKLMFDAAELMQRNVELSLVCRERAVELAQPLGTGYMLFVNTHPDEDFEADVLPQLARLREVAPDLPLVLEVHEGTVHNPQHMREVTARLTDYGVLLAYDDFGAGRSRLLELVQAPPHVLKFDINLIRGIDTAPVHQRRMLKVLVEMTRDFSTAALAEGVETAAEAEVCRELGFDYAQGYLYGKPMNLEELSRNLIEITR